jgi:ribosomal protein S18 acetylase RimI-like enzyme
LGLTIRQATSADAEVLSNLALKIFLDTFGAQNKPEDVELHAKHSYSRDIQLGEINDPALTYLIAEMDGTPAGFAMIGVPRSESCSRFDAPIELFRFYVEKTWHGKGIAQPMMKACENVARSLGGKTICLSVWLENPRAIRFYEKIGFRKEGTQPYVLGNDVQTDWVMVRDLEPESNGHDEA